MRPVKDAANGGQIIVASTPQRLTRGAFSRLHGHDQSQSRVHSFNVLHTSTSSASRRVNIPCAMHVGLAKRSGRPSGLRIIAFAFICRATYSWHSCTGRRGAMQWARSAHRMHGRTTEDIPTRLQCSSPASRKNSLTHSPSPALMDRGRAKNRQCTVDCLVGRNQWLASRRHPYCPCKSEEAILWSSTVTADSMTPQRCNIGCLLYRELSDCSGHLRMRRPESKRGLIRDSVY